MMGWIFLAVVAVILVWLAVSYGLGRPPRHGILWAGGALGSLWAVTAVVLVFRFTQGMGGMTNMTDANP